MNNLTSRLKAIEERKERLTSMTSDQFGHDCDALLSAEAAALFVVAEDLTLLLEVVRVSVEALEKSKTWIGGMEMTMFPIHVREPDGSITMERPKSCAGHAYDIIRDAQDKINKLCGEGEP